MNLPPTQPDMHTFRIFAAVLVAAVLVSGCSSSQNLSAGEQATTLYATYKDDLSFVAQHFRSHGCQPGLNAESTDDARFSCAAQRRDGEPLDVQVSLYGLSDGKVGAVASAWVQTEGEWTPVRLGDASSADVRGVVEGLLIQNQLVAEAHYVRRPATR